MDTLHITQGFSTGVPRNPRVPREIVIEKKKKHRFFELVGQNKQIHRKI